MIDEINPLENRAEATASPGGASTGRAGFCQECGRVLTTETVRRVGNGTFCEPCATARAASGWQPVNGGAYPGSAFPGSAVPGSAVPGVPGPPASDEPNPVLAGVLGLIPGVGAMYNGQYPKGALHLVVFVVLVALADNLSWVMWWLVWGWIFYQAFEAYHTARARRDHLPLPNPFGWNDIGERLGGPRSWPAGTGTPVSGSAARRSSPNWVGYVPPTGPANTASTSAPTNPYENTYPQTASAPPPIPPIPPQQSAGPQSQPAPAAYSPTYTGYAQGSGMGQPATALPAARFPVGAIWLIGLGLLFLLGNLLPEWRLTGRWLVPILLAALAIWTGVRRLETVRSTPSHIGLSPNLAGLLVGPAVLLSVAALLALQDAYVLPLRRSWPIVLVVWGVMLLAQRATDPLLQVPGSDVGAPSTPPTPHGTTSGGPLGL